MMSHDEWLKVLRELVNEIASPEEQEAKWFGTGPLYSSPTELYCQLFDDYTFDLFFEKYSSAFTAAQRDAWIALKRSLENYGETLPAEPEARAVYLDPRWHDVGRVAANWLHQFA